MEITSVCRANNRTEWRAWLAHHHKTEREIWLVLHAGSGAQALTYLDAVEEAMCFGWIDSTKKRLSESERAQRFSPRRPRSNWTELNKARARRLIRLEQMTEAGYATLPDLDAAFVIADDILSALRADPDVWTQFAQLPELYVRVCIGNIESVRKSPDSFSRRLSKFVRDTAAGKMSGNWHDNGRLP